MKYFTSAAGLLALVAVLVFGTMGAKVDTEKVTKAFGGSTGDSCIASADTSLLVRIESNTTALHVVFAADSQSAYKVLVSPNGTKWYQVDIDTVNAGSLESTADLGPAYAGMLLKVVQDPIPAAGAPFGNAWVQQTK